MELEEHAEKMKERVPTEEKDPREVPHEPLRLMVTEGRPWEGGVAGHLACGERRKFERGRQRFRGLNTLGRTPGWTLSGSTGHCLGLLDFIQLGLSVWEDLKN
jgi:hypothetical protein